MADEPSDLSQLPSSSSSNQQTQMTSNDELNDFYCVLEGLGSPDAQTRSHSEQRLALIPHYNKAVLLLKSYLTAAAEEFRHHSLSLLQSHLDKNWRQVFPDPEKMHQFSSELLNAVQHETSVPLRDTLIFLVSTVTKRRLERNGAQWDDLIYYIRESPDSESTHHLTVSLNILIEVPHIFGNDSESCKLFFDACLGWRNSSLLSKILEAIVAVHSSEKGTRETREVLDDRVEEIAQKFSVDINNLMEDHNEENIATCINDIGILIKSSLECSSMDTKVLTLKVIVRTQKMIYSDRTLKNLLDRRILADLRSLIETFLGNAQMSAQSIGLEAYATMVTQESPLADMFPQILSICEDVGTPEEEEEDEANLPSYTPLRALSQMAEDDSPLLLPHIAAIMFLCTQAISYSLQYGKKTFKRDDALTILQCVFSERWTAIIGVVGMNYIEGLVHNLIQSVLFRVESKSVFDLLSVFGKREETRALVSGFIRRCVDSKDDFLLRCALPIVRGAPNVFGNYSDLRTFLEVAFENKETRWSALKEFLVMAESMKEDERVEALGSVVPLLIMISRESELSDVQRTEIFSALCQLSDHSIDLLNIHLPVVLAYCIQMYRHPPYRDGIFEMLSRLCEHVPNSIKTRTPDQIPAMLEIVVENAASEEFNRDASRGIEWIQQERIDHSEWSAYCLKKVVKSLGVETVLPQLHLMAQRYALEGSAEKRFASVLCYAEIGLECTETELASATARLVSFLSDAHPQVRNVACCSLFRMIELRSPRLQEKCHVLILPALVSLLKEISIPRLAAIAGETLAELVKHVPINFVINFESCVLEIMDLLDSAYIQLLAEKKATLMQQILAPISAISKADPLLIYSFYDRLIAPLKRILHERPLGEILGMVVCCVTDIGCVAGKSKFEKEALEVLLYISESTSRGVFNADIMLPKEGFAEAVGRIAAVVAAHSHKFLPALVHSLVSVCKDINTSIEDGDDSFFRRHFAEQILTSLVSSLGAHFAPYVLIVSPVAIEKLRTRSGREAHWCATIFPLLLSALKQCEEYESRMRECWAMLWSAVKGRRDFDEEGGTYLILAFLKSADLIGFSRLTENELREIRELLKREEKLRDEGMKKYSAEAWEKNTLQDEIRVIQNACQELSDVRLSDFFCEKDDVLKAGKE